MKARARSSRLIRPLLTASASMVMAVSFSGCELLDYLTCLQFGECGQLGPIQPQPGAAAPDPAPDAPTNLTAVPGDGEVTLRWTQSTATDVAEYLVLSSGTPGAAGT